MFLILGRNFLKIILCVSFFIPKFAFPSVNVPGKFDRVEVYDDGRYLGIRGADDKRRRVWKGVFDRESGSYLTSEAQDLTVRHVSTGASSTGKVSAVVSSSVSRAGVLAGVGALVRQGAKLGKRAVPYVGTALLAYDIYETFKDDIKEQGYQYDPETDKFLKYYPAQNCIWDRDSRGNVFDVGCFGVDSSIMAKYYNGDYGNQEVKEFMESRMESLARPYWEREKKERAKHSALDWNNFVFSKCTFNWNGGDCSVHKGDDFRGGADFRLKINQRYKEEMNSQRLEEILAAKVDANPDKFIRATNFPGYKEDVEVAPGTKLNIGPVTDKSGNPVQVLVSFGRDSQGKTKADVQVTPRPDLTPGSAEAPNVRPSPDTSPATNPSNNPNPNEQPGTRPNPEPDPDTNPEPNLKPGTSPGSPVLPGTSPANGRDGKDGGLLCRFFPKILACDEQPETEEPNLEIPQETIDLNFTPDNTFSEYSECPAPVTFQALGAEYKISLEPACNLAAMMRPFIIAMAWLVASFFVARVVRNNA